MGAAEVEELAGLGDVLGGRAPVDVAAGVAIADAVEFPDHWDEPGVRCGRGLRGCCPC